MKSKVLAQHVLTMSAIFALVVTFSMVTLANAGDAVGELTVIKSSSANELSSVTINGEVAKSGRTVFPSSTITTPEGVEAIINIGKKGKIELGPNTSFTLSAAPNVAGDLTDGSLTVLSAAQGMSVRTMSGDLVTVAAGEMITASSSSATSAAKAAGPKTVVIPIFGAVAVWLLVTVVTVATVATVAAVAISNNNNNSRCTVTVSPTC